MSRQVLDYDPLTGITTYFDYEAGDRGTDRMHITTVQDVNDIVDQARTLANDPEYSRAGIRNDLWHYARIPLNVLMEIETVHGVKCVGDVKDWKSFFAVINKHYPALKVTSGTHN